VRPEPVIVMGEAPSAVKEVQEAVPAQETEVVAALPSVVTPEVCVKYASPGTAMPDVVAIWYRSFAEIVTFPVAPETEIPSPAMLERTPVFVTLPPLYVRPEEKVVVATPVQPFVVYPRTWPGVPVKSELVVVARERYARRLQRMTSLMLL